MLQNLLRKILHLAHLLLIFFFLFIYKKIQRVVMVERNSAKEDKGQKQEIQGAYGLHGGGG